MCIHSDSGVLSVQSQISEVGAVPLKAMKSTSYLRHRRMVQMPGANPGIGMHQSEVSEGFFEFDI